VITLSAAAQKALLQHTARPAFTASVQYNSTDGKIRKGGPQTLDLTALVEAFPAMRLSIRPSERIPELTGMTVKVFNKDDMLNITNADGWVGDDHWHRARLTIKLGVEIGMTEEVVGTIVGELDDVIANYDDNTVEMSFVDPFARLKGSNFGNAYGSYRDTVPTLVVKTLLQRAGFTSDLDDTSFDDAIESERRQDLKIQLYTPSTEENSTTWWDAIKFMLHHVNAGLFWNSDGKIEIFKLAPSIDPPVFTFNRTVNTHSIKMQSPGGHIVNKYNIFMQFPNSEDTTNYWGGNENNEPFQVLNQDSIDIFGTLEEDLEYAWTWDNFGVATTAENQALLRLDVTAFGPKVLKLRATLDTFVAELWDYVRILDSETGIDINGFVFEKSIDFESAVCHFKVFHMPLTAPDPDDPTVQWLYTNNSQKYDDGELIRGEVA
jgi:hypothetical protein